MDEVAMGVSAAVSYVALHAASERYLAPGLGLTDQSLAAELATRTCTVLQSLLAVWLGVNVLKDPTLRADRIAGRSAVLEMTIPVFLVAFSFDVIAKWKSYRLARCSPSLAAFCQSECVMLAHHAFVIAMIAVVRAVQRGEYFAGHMMLCEISALPLQLRWLLAATGWKNTMAYPATGAVLLATHFYSRILVFPRILQAYGEARDGVAWVTAFTLLPRQCQFGVVLLAAPQVYWFYLMLRSLARKLTRHAVREAVKSDRSKYD